MGYDKFLRSDAVTSLLESITITNQLIREMLAEFLGVLLLCSIGNGAVAQMVLSRNKNGDFISVNWAYGLGVAMAVYVAGNVSGAHLNPAISVTFTLMGRLPWHKLPCYLVAQVLGGFVSGAVVYSVYYDAIETFDGKFTVIGENATAGIFATYPQDFLSTSNGFWDQVFGTSLLSGLVIAITTDNRVTDGLTPLLVGLIVFSIGLSFGFNCGYAINPARDFGPRLFTYAVGYQEVFTAYNNWFWVPIVAPLVGGVMGAFVYKMLVGHHMPEVEEGGTEREERVAADRTTKL